MHLSRHTAKLAPVLAAFALFSIGADSCGTSTKTTADKPSKKGQDTGGSDSTTAVLGQPITLKGTDTTMEVTPTKIIDPLSVGQFDSVGKGNRAIGVELTLKNAGDKTYSDSPSNGMVVITKDGQQSQTAILSEGECSIDGFSSQATISPSSERRGCVAVEIPAASKVGTVQFTLDSGFGPEAGEWTVP